MGPKNREEFRKWKERRSNVMGLLIIILSCMLVVVPIATIFYCHSKLMYTYNRNVSAYIFKARYGGFTPELIKENLLLTKQGMLDAGLSNDSYCVIFTWDRFPSTQMQYVYDSIDGLVERADYIIEWRDTHITDDLAEYEDVYNLMISNLRGELYDAPFYNAEGTWMLKHATFAYYSGIFAWTVDILFVLLIIYLWWKLYVSGYYDWYDYARKHNLDR